MDQSFIYEIIGYVASALVAISLMMSSILKLRLINLTGAITFTIYGLLIGAYPVVIVNFVIVLINLYYLREIFTTNEYFTLLEVQQDSDYLRQFLTFYEADIGRFLPRFSYAASPRQRVFFVLRDMVPAGLFIAEPRDGRSLMVNLDFVIPRYRDFAIGKYVYSKESGLFKEQHIQQVYAEPGSPNHTKYLRRMGFRPDGDNLYSTRIQ